MESSRAGDITSPQTRAAATSARSKYHYRLHMRCSRRLV